MLLTYLINAAFKKKAPGGQKPEGPRPEPVHRLLCGVESQCPPRQKNDALVVIIDRIITKHNMKTKKTQQDSTFSDQQLLFDAARLRLLKSSSGP